MVLVALEQIQTGTGVTNGEVSVIGLDLFSLSTAAPRFVNTHWMPAKSEHVAQCKGIWKHRSGLRTRHSESEFVVRNPRSRHSGIHLCDLNPFFEIRNLITREQNTFFEIPNLPVRISAIHRSESGISPSWSGIHHAESETHGRDTGFNTRPYFYLFPLTLREQSMKQLFCHTFSSRCQQKSLSRWLSRLSSIFRGRSAQRCQFLEFAEPTAQNCRLHGYSCLQPTLDDPLGIHKISNTWP